VGRRQINPEYAMPTTTGAATRVLPDAQIVNLEIFGRFHGLVI
jgi:hypothetical protein